MKNTLWLFSILLLFVSTPRAQTQSVPAEIGAKMCRQAQMTYVHTQIPHDEEYAAAVLSNGSVVLADGKIVPGVLLAKKPSAQTPGVEVEVYDYAALELPTLRKFARSTQEILSRTGICINVVLCERTTAGSCENPDNRKKLLLRILPGSAKKMHNALYSPLGQSFADHSGGRYASVFLESIKDQASEANIPWLTVLDYAAVHEIGHLLLGDQAHAPRGIMEERWDVNDYVNMAQGRFQFSGEQIRQLRGRYASSAQVEASPIEARH